MGRTVLETNGNTGQPEQSQPTLLNTWGAEMNNNTNLSEDEQLQMAIRASLEEQERRQRAEREEAAWRRLEAERLQAEADARAVENAQKNREEEDDQIESATVQPVENSVDREIALMEWDRQKYRSGVRCGLKNLGNSCFLNASLQCLAHVAPLTQMFAGADEWQHQCDDRTKFCALCECVKLFPQMCSVGTTKKRVVRPARIFRNLSKINDCLYPSRQEDAHEFIASLLDRWETADQSGRVVDLMTGSTRTITRCGNCLAESSRDEPFALLSLEVAGSMNESLTLMSNPELLRGKDAYFCDGCESKKIASKRIKILKCPPVLMIHLKRFEVSSDWTSLCKIDTYERFPLQLEIGSHFCEGTDVKQYELVSVLVHAGTMLGSGHYYANVKGPDGNWYRCNDDSVYKIGVRQVLDEQAYILVYKQVSSCGDEDVAAVVDDDCCSVVSDASATSGSESSVTEEFSDDDGEGGVSSLIGESFEAVPFLSWGDAGFDTEFDPYLRGEWVI